MLTIMLYHQLTINLFSVQITNTIISALPMNALDWYEGSDAVLICTIETNKATSDGLIVEWSNSNGAINTGNFTSSLSDIVHQSVLELKSLSVHSDVYYCKASIAGAGIKQDWHYVNVESSKMLIIILKVITGVLEFIV